MRTQRWLAYERWLVYSGFAAAMLFLMSVTAFAETTILNVSYDVSRERAALQVIAPIPKTSGWTKVQSEHFADGALYDQISTKK